LARRAGYHHFCLTVGDIDATVAELRRRGVTIVTDPFVLEVISASWRSSPIHGQSDRTGAVDALTEA
jgi:hypothetical protein